MGQHCLGHRQLFDQTGAFDSFVSDHNPYFRLVQLCHQWLHAVFDVLVSGSRIPLHELRYGIPRGFDHVGRAYAPEQR